MHRRPIATTVLIVALTVLTALGCAKTATTTETGGASGNPSGSTVPSTPPKTVSPAYKRECTPAYNPANPTTILTTDCGVGTPGTPPTTCVSAPATTGVGTRGGGEIICSNPGDDGSQTSPPMTDTTIPVPRAPIAQPDATHGALTIITGGPPCPKSAEACVAMFQVVPAAIHLERQGGTSVDGATGGMEGMYSVQLNPGTWQVTATPLEGDRVCTPQTVEITAGEATSISIDCELPG